MGQVVPVSVRVSNDSSSSSRPAIVRDRDAAPPSVGQDLTEARKRRGKTLEDVSGDLKILPNYLTAIETGHFEDMPVRVYAIGYVRSYAAYLGLDVASLLARFRVEMASFDAAHAEAAAMSQLEDEPAPKQESVMYRYAKQRLSGLAPSRETVLQAVGVMILITALSYSAYYVTSSSPRSVPSIPLAPVQLADQAEAPDEDTAQPSSAAGEREGHQAELPPANSAPPVPPPEDAQLAAVEQPPANPTPPAPAPSTDVASLQPEPAPPVVKKEMPPPAVKQTAPSRSDEVTVVGASAVKQAQVLRVSLPLGQHYGTRNKSSRVTLRLHGATEVRVGKSAKQIFIDRALDAGDTYRVPNLSGLKLSAQDAGAVEIILDDTTIGFAGKNGVPAREISLDPKAIAQLQQGG